MVKPHKAKRNKPFTQQRSKQPVINIECGVWGGGVAGLNPDQVKISKPSFFKSYILCGANAQQ